LRVNYIAANPPSPVPEEAEEEDSSPRSEVMGNEVNRPSVCDLVSNELMFFKLAIKDYTTHFLMICFFRLQAHTNEGAYREEPSCAEVTLCSVCQSFLNSPLALFS
jgi:hypothetical protein